MSIRHWPTSERPREKLLAHGSEALSDAELIAVLLGGGVPGKDAVMLARELLQQAGSLTRLLTCARHEFASVVGLGAARRARLIAGLELARRTLAEGLQHSKHGLRGSIDSAEFLRAKLAHLPYEVFACLYLDNRHRVLAFEELFRGTIDGASVYPREVVRACLKHNASAVIFAHNHPSGVAEPSDMDLQLTRQLCHALSLIEIRVLDHLVIGAEDPVSMAHRGLL